MESDRSVLPREIHEKDPLLDLACQRIDLLVRTAALEQRLLGADPHDPYRGLLLSDQEVDLLLEALPDTSPAELSHPLLLQLRAQLATVEKGLEAQGTPPTSRLGWLQARLQLEPLDRDILLLALLQEIDPRYGRLFAFLQDDVTRSHPGVFIALRLFCRDEQTRQQGRARFLSTSPLCKHLLIRLLDHPHDPAPSLLQQTLQADSRIVGYLLDAGASDKAPFPFLHQAKPGRPLADLLFPDEIQSSLRALLPSIARGETQLLLLEGTPGSGRRTAARALARELGRPLLEITPAPEHETDRPNPERARLALREACLQQALLLWSEGRGQALPELEHLGSLIGQYRVPVILAREQFAVEKHMPAATVCLHFPSPGAPLRQRLWEARLADRLLSQVQVTELALRFRLSGGQIGQAVAWAEGLARRHGRPVIGQEELEEAIAFVAMPTLDQLARPIIPRYDWPDIVLPEDVRAHLREFTAAIRRRDQVYDRWGFDRRRPLARGLNALFAGPSGTGKTMAAEIIAGELGLALFKIDLSAVVSKYVGETEKHLRKLFTEAAQGNVILFFDEADALFGKRSEVRDAHDRYANIEVAYLLQALEEHAGVVILASNLFGNLDDAFVRRMHFIIHFPFPQEDMRRRIWEVIFPAQAPVSEEIDPTDLAGRFKVTGGHIRNIALGAAFLAADDGGSISMQHLLQSARREFQKMSKVIDENSFILTKEEPQE